MTRSKRKWIRVNEGECYAVPLRDGSYGVGVIARTGRQGALFGYFFGPRYLQVPTIDDARRLQVADAVLCELFGDLGVQLNEWVLLGHMEPWDRSQWPLPKFGRIEDEARGIAWIVSYADTDVSVVTDERRCSVEEARQLPPDTTAGYGAVEIELRMMLSDERSIDKTAG